MRLLLDTHILLWCLDGDENLPEKARQIILSADAVYVSAANIWEIIIKQSTGKLKIQTDPQDLVQTMTDSGFEMLSIKPEHALKLVDLQDIHRDPFDRILIAQSLVEPLHLVTCDSVVAQYGGNTIRV
ncbi:MAG: type II toxin-antitoxin system VapC family toxin [bacterium]